MHDIEESVGERKGVCITDDEIYVFRSTVRGCIASLVNNFLCVVEAPHMSAGDERSAVIVQAHNQCPIFSFPGRIFQRVSSWKYATCARAIQMDGAIGVDGNFPRHCAYDGSFLIRSVKLSH